jgi:acyl carrier protein
MNDTLTTQEDQTLRQILKEQLDVTDDQITPAAHIEHDLGADSLDKVEISMQVEERFDLTIPDEDWDGVETVADLQESLARLLATSRRR